MEYKSDEDSKWTEVNEDFKIEETSFNVFGLKTNSKYKFRVKAENSTGYGFYSDESEEIIVEKKIDKEICFIEELADRILFLGDKLELKTVLKGGDGNEIVYWYGNPVFLFILFNKLCKFPGKRTE